MLIISLGCLAIHLKTINDRNLYINEQIRQQNHMDSIYISIQNSLDSIQIMLDSYK